jgi:hypothetical protein
MKKNILMFTAAMLSFSHVLVFPAEQLTAQQEQTRLEWLWNLKNNNSVTIAQFTGNGESVGSIIDRDIALLEKDGQQALKQKASAEGFIYSRIVPGMLKGVAIGSAAIAAIGSIFSIAGFAAGYNAWSKPDNFVDRSALGMINQVPGNFWDKAELKLRYLTEGSANSDYNQVALTAGGAAPFTTVASIILAGISKYSFSKNASWNKRNAEFIQEMQNRFNRDQAIIADLKQIKHDNRLA